ncbi:T9SS type A sorting domain-containing protein [bacterium BMS3Abin03]|nr:T9SS type A sorting domain-containing protein [bacterium BMS3Abin03]
MKHYKLLPTLLLGCFLSTVMLTNTQAQTYTGDLTLTSQAQVDAFNYTRVTGNLTIQEAIPGNITNLDGLSGLIGLGQLDYGSLYIDSNIALTNLDGLASLLTVHGSLFISGNTALTNLDGLSSLDWVGRHLFISYNNSLTNIDGLSNIDNSFIYPGGDGRFITEGELHIDHNAALTNIDGISNLTSCHLLLIEENAALTNIDGLSNLTSCDIIVIYNNTALTNIDGLSSLTFLDTMYLFYNAALTEFCTLYHLITQDNYLGAILIEHNAANPTERDIINGGPCITPTDPTGVGDADPSSVASGGISLLTVTVTPGANPTSTGLTVTGNLSSIGGSATQQFYDDGTNGDVTAVDNIFSYNATIDGETTPGNKNLPVTIADAESRIGSSSISLEVTVPPPAGSYDIYTVNVKTGNTERVTFLDDADEFNPSSAPGGINIVHDVKGGSAPFGHSIYITDISTGVSSLLVGAEGGNDASWSPDSLNIAFDRLPVGDPSIYIVPSTGGTSTLIRNDAVDVDWSNNGKRLVFQDITDGSIRTVDLNGGSETTVVSSGTNPSWSGNGKYITYTDGNNIYKIKVNKTGEPRGNPVQLTFDGTEVYSQQPSWSKNNKTIVFHSNRVSGNFDIWTVPASGGTPELLTGNQDYGDYDPCYSKNGNNVAYAGFTFFDSSPKRNNNGESVSLNENSLPNKYVLEQNFPNPFNPTTQIRFGIPEAGSVTLKIYNSVGQLVKTLVDGNMSEGYHQVTWDATDNSGSKLSSGVYFYRITTGTFAQVNKMLLLK